MIGHVFWDEALRRIAPTRRRSARRPDAARARLRPRDERLRGHARVRLQAPRAAPGRLPGRAQAVAARAASRDGRLAGRSQRRSRERVLRPDRRALRARRRHRQRGRLPAQAGEDAARSYVNAAALDYLGRALALRPADDAATRFALLRDADRASTATPAARERAGRGRRRARAGSPSGSTTMPCAPAPPACARRSRSSSATIPARSAAAARAVALGRARRPAGAALRARINWARALQFQGDYAARARRTSSESLVLAREVGDRSVEATTLGAARHPRDAARPLRHRPRLLPRRRSPSLARSATARSRAA